MQDSIELPSSQGQQDFKPTTQNNTFQKPKLQNYSHNHQQQPSQLQPQLQTEKPSFNDIISPKGRKLTKFSNQYKNTNSQQSLAYSNSTYNKWTERGQLQKQRSPGTGIFFNNTNQNLQFDQNINTLNFLKSSEKKKSNQGLFSSTHKDNRHIQFSKIYQEQSGLQQQQDEGYGGRSAHCSRIQNNGLYLFNFKSENPSPNKYFSTNKDEEDQHNYEQSSSQSQRFDSKISNNNNKRSSNKYRQKDQSKVSDKSQSKNQKEINSSLKSRNVEPNSKIIKSTLNKSHNISQRSNSINSIKSHSNSKNKKQVKESLTNSNYNTKQNSINSYRQKVKQLQYALKVQSIISEELRTKVNVLNELLEEKFLQKNGINLKLFFNGQKSKNVNKNHNRHKSSQNTDKPIQLYVQMRILQKRNNQLQILNQRFKDTLKDKQTQIKSLSTKISQFQNKKTNSNTQTPFQNHNQLSNNSQMNSNTNGNLSNLSPNGKSFSSEQKQTLLQYIDNQQHQLNEKTSNIKQIQNQCQQFTHQLLELKSHIKMLQQKQRRFSQQQRPKLFTQIKQLSTQLNNRREENQKLQMQNNLIKMTNEQLNNNMSLSKYNLTSRQNSATSSPYKSIGKNTQRRGGLNSNNNDNNSNYISVDMRTNQMQKQNQQRQNSNDNKQYDCEDTYAQNKLIKVIKDPSKDLLSLTLLQQEQLSLLKKQRDHFMAQFQNMKMVSNENYQLRLHNQQILEELKEYKEIMESVRDCQNYHQVA